MGVKIDNISFTNEFTGLGDSTNYLLGNVGDYVNIIIDFTVEQFAIDVFDEQDIVAFPSSSTLTTDRSTLIQSDTDLFSDFKIGDDIEIFGTASNDGTYQIVDILDPFNIRVDSALTNEDFPTNSYIALTTPISGLEYKWNFIENNATETFESLVDGQVQKFTLNDADASDPAFNVMKSTGKNSLNFSSISVASIKGLGIVNGSQKFQLYHNTIISPFFLADQIDDLKNGIPPDYFADGNSLGAVFEISAGRNLNDKNTMQVSEEQRLIGNTGWFNENFNTGTTNYSIENLNYNNTLGTIDLENPHQITFSIKNTTDSPFTTFTEARVHLIYLPKNESEYQKNDEFMSDNFMYNSNGIASSGLDSDRNGGQYQIFETGVSTLISPDELLVTLDIDADPFVRDLILSKDNPEFLMFVSVQQDGLTTLNSDRVSLIVDINNFGIELTTANLISNTTRFLQHYTNTEVIEKFCANPVDDIIANSEFSIDFAGLETDGIKIVEIENNVLLKHSTEPDVVLESSSVNVAGSPLNGLGQYINVQQDRNFKLNSGDIRRQISITSNTPSGTVYSWNMKFPFFKRFEYWESLNLNTLPAGLVDFAEPHNGLNHDWFRLASQSGWTMYHQTRFVIEQNGVNFEQKFDNQIFCADFLSNPDWINESIDTFSVDGLTDYNKKILGFEDVLVKASFEWAGVTAPDLSDIEMVVWLGTFEQGGINTICKASSVYDIETIQPFKSIDASNKVVVTEPTAGTFLGEVIVDHTKIPAGKNFNLYARLHDKRKKISFP